LQEFTARLQIVEIVPAGRVQPIAHDFARYAVVAVAALIGRVIAFPIEPGAGPRRRAEVLRVTGIAVLRRGSLVVVGIPVAIAIMVTVAVAIAGVVIGRPTPRRLPEIGGKSGDGRE
jgi:hypothetical protein